MNVNGFLTLYKFVSCCKVWRINMAVIDIVILSLNGLDGINCLQFCHYFVSKIIHDDGYMYTSIYFLKHVFVNIYIPTLVY